jgi:hypothetical protein
MASIRAKMQASGQGPNSKPYPEGGNEGELMGQIPMALQLVPAVAASLSGRARCWASSCPQRTCPPEIGLRRRHSERRNHLARGRGSPARSRTGEQNGAIRSGVGGGRRRNQEECGIAKHGPNGGREAVSQAHDRIREAVNRNKKEKLTVLLHHVSVDVLRWAFLQLEETVCT